MGERSMTVHRGARGPSTGPSRTSALRRRVERSWLWTVAARLRDLDVANQATLLGAGPLASLLPFLILLSAFAKERVDDDIALRLGLDHRAAAIVSHLFRALPLR
jgi:hypothetical protein